jgi:hypothetical protein
MRYCSDYTKTVIQRQSLPQELELHQHGTVKESDNKEVDDDETPEGNQKTSSITYQHHGNDEISIEKSWTHGVSQQPTCNRKVAVAAPEKLPPAMPTAKLPPANTRTTTPQYSSGLLPIVSSAIPHNRLIIPSSGYLDPLPTIHNLAEISDRIKKKTFGHTCAVPGANVRTETEPPREALTYAEDYIIAYALHLLNVVSHSRVYKTTLDYYALPGIKRHIPWYAVKTSELPDVIHGY